MTVRGATCDGEECDSEVTVRGATLRRGATARRGATVRGATVRLCGCDSDNEGATATVRVRSQQ